MFPTQLRVSICMETIMQQSGRRPIHPNGQSTMHDTAFRRLLWWVFTGTRGGVNRVRVIVALSEQPMNAHRVAQLLDVDYKTVMHHLNVLRRNHLIVKTGEGYGGMYFPSPELEEGFSDFQFVQQRICRPLLNSNRP